MRVLSRPGDLPLLLPTLLLCGTSLATAATLRIPSEYPTFQAAIDAAASGDTVLAAPALYGGDGNRDILFRGGPLTVLSESGPEETTIDCGGPPHRGFLLKSADAARVTIQGFTITNGETSRGGAIYANASQVVIRDCILLGNRSDSDGGAIYVTSSARGLLIEGCSFTTNEADDYGGALYVPCVDIEVTDCRFIDNSARSGGATAYIAYRCTSSFDITNSLFLNNRSANHGAGGGAYSAGDNPGYSHCTFIDNEAAIGGGIYAENGCVAQHCLFRNNIADTGGGISSWKDENAGFSTGLYSCVFIYNRGHYGAAAVEGTVSRLEHCTITENDNHSSIGGRGAVTIYPEYPASIANSIIWGNKSATDLAALEAGAQYRYNNIGHAVPGTGNINVDPMITNHFGFPALLRPGSPCVDAGDPSESDSIYDQTPGWPEWYRDGVRADMGAYGGRGNGQWLE
jgi:predicted outer membrane repeat protein